MIALQSHAYNKNKCNLISCSLIIYGGTDLLTWCLNIRVDYFFFNSMSDSPFYCNACSVHLEKTTDDKKSRRKGDKTIQENTLESR